MIFAVYQTKNHHVHTGKAPKCNNSIDSSRYLAINLNADDDHERPVPQIEQGKFSIILIVTSLHVLLKLMS